MQYPEITITKVDNGYLVKTVIPNWYLNGDTEYKTEVYTENELTHVIRKIPVVFGEHLLIRTERVVVKGDEPKAE